MIWTKEYACEVWLIVTDSLYVCLFMYSNVIVLIFTLTKSLFYLYSYIVDNYTQVDCDSFKDEYTAVCTQTITIRLLKYNKKKCICDCEHIAINSSPSNKRKLSVDCWFPFRVHKRTASSCLIIGPILIKISQHIWLPNVYFISMLYAYA